MADAKTDETRDYFNRVNDLEYAITKTRDALRLISTGLEDMAERHSTTDAMELTKDDISMLYGAVTLLDYIANECDRAYWEKGER